MRTHREEQRRREAERRALELRRREDEERRKREHEVRAREGRGLEEEQSESRAGASELCLSGEEDVLSKEVEVEVVVDCSPEHRYDTDRLASRDAPNAPLEELEPFDLDKDLEQELLEAELTVDIKVPGHLAVRDVQDKLEKEPKTWVASQETDYGDLDVTVEELDDFL